MPNVLFWNVQGKPLTGLVEAIVRHENVDLVILLEPPARTATLTAALGTVGPFERIPSHPRFRVFSRLGPTATERLDAPAIGNRIGCWRLMCGGDATQDVLLVAIHGPDRRSEHEEEERTHFFRRLAREVSRLEEEQGHRRTILVGDLNSNPFEPAMLSASGLHAIPVPWVNGRSWRIVKGEAYHFFYNPMWSRFGDGQSAPRGSYYWHPAKLTQPFWHLIDQVVYRPEAIELVPEDRVHILDRAGAASLLPAL